MDFKKKLRNFISLTAKAREGFTLVELIVVIAILAILAGVAIPAYTGYIKRAEEAKDQLLIAAINEAFAGACLEAGIELATVTDAKISVVEQCVFGVSSVEVAGSAVSDAQLAGIYGTFNQLYEGNFATPFKTENVLSLDWVPEEHSFKMDHENAVASTIILSNGKTLNVSAEDMAIIAASAYADMGAAEVTAVIENLGSSSENLVGMAKSLNMGDRFSAVLLANGLVTDSAIADSMSAEEVANGLQMVTAKYLATATPEKIAALMTTNLYGRTETMLGTLATGTGGTVTVSAAAAQYAVVQAFANTKESESIAFSGSVRLKTGSGLFDYTKFNYNCTGVTEFLNSDAAKADPVWALSQVQNTSEYKAYTQTEQYTSDLNGFVGTMSVLGDNIGTVSNPGALDIEGYFNNGVNSTDAQDALSAVLGK